MSLVEKALAEFRTAEAKVVAAIKADPTTARRLYPELAAGKTWPIAEAASCALYAPVPWKWEDYA